MLAEHIFSSFETCCFSRFFVVAKIRLSDQEVPEPIATDYRTGIETLLYGLSAE